MWQDGPDAEDNYDSAERFDVEGLHTSKAKRHLLRRSEKTGTWWFLRRLLDRLINFRHFDQWEKYYDEMHRTQGFGITTWPPDFSSYRATILPYQFTEDDGVTVLPEINDMCDECIKNYKKKGLYYLYASDPPEYEYDGKVHYAAVCTTNRYSLYFVTCSASRVDDPTTEELFLCQYVVWKDENGGRTAGYCRGYREDELLSWNLYYNPCALACCSESMYGKRWRERNDDVRYSFRPWMELNPFPRILNRKLKFSLLGFEIEFSCRLFITHSGDERYWHS